MGVKYLFVETVSSMGTVQNAHGEAFNTREEACARLKQIYHDTVIEGDPEEISHTDFAEDDAYVCYKDMCEIDWDVVEEEV